MEEGERAKEWGQKAQASRVELWFLCENVRAEEGTHSREVANLEDQNTQTIHFTGFFGKV